MPNEDATLRQRRRRRRLILAGAAATPIALLVAGELVARYALGLGDPPITVPDAELEYHLAPGVYRRFGNTVTIDERFMRGGPFPRSREADGRRRVLVMGDSVINGGGQTDDADLATARLARAVDAAVGNASAGSWGPANLLAWVRRFGLADVDALVVVVSSHDVADVPEFTAARTPVPASALIEGITSYALPRARGALGLADPPEPERTPDELAADTESALAALRELVDLARTAGVPVAIVHHATWAETEGELWEPGHSVLAATAAELGVPWVETRPRYARALAEGRHIYRDSIHPTAAGQAVLAEALADALDRLPPTTRPGG